tara:strand:+ start:1125 stop:1298 length:174 start_codon:yes stop_codon:yes gene_type:complete
MNIEDHRNIVRNIYNTSGFSIEYKMACDNLHNIYLYKMAAQFRIAHNLGDKEKTPYC